MSTLSQKWALKQTPDASFQGQRVDENIVFLKRQHIISLLLPAWPVAAGLLILSLFLLGQYVTQTAGLLWNVAEIFAGTITIGLLFRWAIFTAYVWWFTLYIITDQRIILSKRGLSLDIIEIPLGKVQKVQVSNDLPDEWLFRYGRVKITMAGGDPVLFDKIAQPFHVMNLVQRAQSEHSAPKEVKQIEDQALAEIINRLAIPDPLPVSPELDSLLTSHWPFSRALNFPLDQNERLLGIIARHWIVLLTRSLIPLGLLIAALIASSVGAAAHAPFALSLAAILGFVGILYEIIIYLNFADDVYLVTTRRVIDIERYFFVIFTSSTSIELKNIIKTEPKKSVAGNVFQFGDVNIDVPEDSEGKKAIVMENVPYPELIATALSNLKNDAQKRDAASKINEQRKDTREWFVEVIGEMIVTTPDFTNMIYETAFEKAMSVGLHPIIAGEIPFFGLTGGYVIGQLPRSGTRALRGSDISFLLSSTFTLPQK